MSTPTLRNRLELQDYAGNPDTWGEHLNAVVAGIDESLDGSVDVDLRNGSHVLASADYASHEARRRILRTIGGGVLTVPRREKWWIVLATDACTVTDGATSLAVRPGFSIVAASPTAPLVVHGVARSASVPVFAAVAAVTPLHAGALVLVSGTVPVDLPVGSHIDVKAVAAAVVGGIRFRAGASARLVRTDGGLVFMGETSGVTSG